METVRGRDQRAARAEPDGPRAADDASPTRPRRRPGSGRAARRRRAAVASESSPTACTASRAATSRWPSSSRTRVVVLEGGQSEARGLAIIAETKRLFPSQADQVRRQHASALRSRRAASRRSSAERHHDPHRRQQPVLRRARRSGSPRTLVGDALAKSHKKPKVEGVIEQDGARSDDTRTDRARITSTSSSTATAMLIAYLPKEKILFTADFNVPGAGAGRQPVDCRRSSQNIERLQLDFERHVDGARAQSGPPDDQGRSAGAGQGNQLKWTWTGRQASSDDGQLVTRSSCSSSAGVATYGPAAGSPFVRSNLPRSGHHRSRRQRLA